MRTIRKGDTGIEVKYLQEYLGLEQDGIFGPGTEKKVKEYQEKYNLGSDGVVGVNTWLSLISKDQESPSLNLSDYIKASIELNVDLASIRAVYEVESGGKWKTSGHLTLLFEGHVFWRELEKKNIDPQKYVKGNEDILYKDWTKKYYSQDQLRRLQKAIKINSDAAYRSASYGLFQIMGNNCKKCGYQDAEEMYKDLDSRENSSLRSFVKFIKNTGLDGYLKNHDWSGFARRYNGPGYKSNKYDKKLEQSYNKYK